MNRHILVIVAFCVSALSAIADGMRMVCPLVAAYIKEATSTYGLLEYRAWTNSVVRSYLSKPEDGNDRPVPVQLSWSPVAGSVAYRVTVSPKVGFEGECVRATVTKTSFGIENLRTGADYAWRIESVVADGAVSLVTNGVFSTEANVVRWLHVPGVRNVRDIGGWTGLRQGRVYRGSQLNMLDGYPVGMMPEGRQVLVRKLGVRTEVDFRAPTQNERGDFVNEGALGVRFLSRPIPPPPRLFNLEAAESYREALRVFAATDNYPIYMHCAAGAERTGLIAFMLEGLCGVPEEILAADIELTSFSCFKIRPRDLPRFRACIEKVRTYRGDSLKDKFADFAVRGLGLSPEEVQAIQSNLTKVDASPVKVILDTDMITDFDDVGALACLHALADMGECEILATVSCTRGNASTAAIGVINGYYGRADLPVGCAKDMGVIGAYAGAKEKVDPVSPLGKKGDGADGHYKYRKLALDYPQWVKYLDSDTAPDANEVYRKALAGAPDKSVVICSIGFLTNMRRLIETPADDISPLSGRELVEKKVIKWVAMACRYPKGKEYNSQYDGQSSRIALENWPTPVVFSDWQYGGDVYAGRAIAEMAGPRNPVKDVFAGNIPSREDVRKDPGKWRDWCFGMGGRAAWDETAVLAAVRGEDSYFNVHRGTYKMIDDTGENVWIPDEENGPHLRITEKVNKLEVAEIIDELICRPPLRDLTRPSRVPVK